MVYVRGHYNRLFVKRRLKFRQNAAAQLELEKWYALPDGEPMYEFKHLVDNHVDYLGAPLLYEIANKRYSQDHVVYRDPRNRFIVLVNAKTSLFTPESAKWFESLIRTMVVPTAKFYDIVDADKEDCKLLNEMAQTVTDLYDQLSFRIKVARLTEKVAIDTIHRQGMDEEEELAALEKLDQTVTWFLRFQDRNSLFLYFHPHPIHTVGQLHMHADITDEGGEACYDEYAVSLAAVNRVIFDTEEDLDSDSSQRDVTDWVSCRHRSSASSTASADSSD
ncbi:hypothetical protein H4R35_003056 [Dimargaris xerosporica]|nr:hypothetical protein H4R35_003056 [Dimargaris xerosporica]